MGLSSLSTEPYQSDMGLSSLSTEPHQSDVGLQFLFTESYQNDVVFHSYQWNHIEVTCAVSHLLQVGR